VIRGKENQDGGYTFNERDITKEVTRLKGTAHAQFLGFVGMDKHHADYPHSVNARQ
jgi:hypothetical protein